MNSRLIEDGIVIEDGFDPDLSAAFQQFTEQLNDAEGAEGFIKVYRLPMDERGRPAANSMKQSHLFDENIGNCTIADVLARVRRDFMGPGMTVTTIRVTAHQRGQRGLKFNRIFTVEKPIEQPKDMPGNNTSDVARLLQIMQENSRQQSERTESFMREMLQMQMQANVQRAQAVALPTATDPVGMITQIGTLMGVFQKMFAPIAPVSASDPLEQLTKTFTALKTLGVMGGKDENENGFAGIVKALTPLAKPALELMTVAAAGQNQQRAQAARRVAAPAAPQVASPENPQPPTDQPPEEADPVNLSQLQQIREYLTQACVHAEAGDDPASVAALLLDVLPEENDAQVSALVSDPDSYAGKLKLICPATAKFPEWFEQLRLSLAAAYEDEPDAQTH